MLTQEEKSQSENQFNFIPPEIFIGILKYLSPKEIAILSRVSKDFNILSNSNYVWFDFFQKYMASLRIAPEFDTKKNYKDIYQNPLTEVMEILPCSEELKGNRITNTYSFFKSTYLVPNYTSNKFIVTTFKENEEINILIEYKKDSLLYVLILFFENNVFKVNALSQEEINAYKDKLKLNNNSVTSSYVLSNQTKENFFNNLFKKINKPLNVSSREFMKNILINEPLTKKYWDRVFYTIERTFDPSSNCLTM